MPILQFSHLRASTFGAENQDILLRNFEPEKMVWVFSFSVHLNVEAFPVMYPCDISSPHAGHTKSDKESWPLGADMWERRLTPS